MRCRGGRRPASGELAIKPRPFGYATWPNPIALCRIGFWREIVVDGP
jgi:hypothetical protein